MVVKQASLAVVVAACAALFAAPVFAADAPAGAPAAPAASSNMGAMHMAPAKKAHAAHAAHAKKSAKKTAAEHHANSADGLTIAGNDARFAPDVRRSSAFVADWSGDKLAVGPNALGVGLKPFEKR